MVERYYRKIENVENDIENAMQISSILLKLKGYDNGLGKIDTNENNISSNLTKINDNENSISNNLGKIDNISEFILKSDKDFEKTYNIESQTFRFNTNNHFFSILEKEIEHDFIKNSLLFVKNNIYYKYDNLSNDYHRCQHEYNIYDNENNLIHKYLSNKDTYYEENSNILNTTEEFCIYFKKNYNKIKIVLELHRHNRHGFGNINLEIDYNKDNYLKLDYIEKGFLDNSLLINLNTGSISNNSGLISTNTSDISDNKDLIETNTSTISDIEKGVELFIEPYNETFIFSNRTITTNSQILFEKIINFDFSGFGVFNILTTCNYDKYNFSHEYHIFDNDELIFKKSINVSSNVVKDEFKFKSVDTSSLKIILYLTDNHNNEKIKLFGKNSLQFRYSKIKFKTDINENDIKSNLEKINDNLDLINTNTRNISFNKGLITNIKNNSTIIHDDVYNETFIFSNRTTTIESQLIFKKTIDFNFSNNGFFNILTTCNYDYDTKDNFNHKYRFFNNDELLKEEIIPNNMISNFVKDEFKFEGIGDISSLKIEIYITGNFNNETIKLLSNSSLQFRYSKIEFKTDINENNIKSNLGLINTNKSDIVSNLGLISTNTSKIDNLEKNLYLKNLFNELYHEVDIKVSHIFYDETFLINAKRNDFLEVYFKMLLKYDDISNAKYVDTNFILYDMSNGQELFIKSYDNEDYIGVTNAEIILNNAFHFNFDNDVTKLKISITFSWTRSNLNITYKSINSNRLIIKHYGN